MKLFSFAYYSGKTNLVNIQKGEGGLDKFLFYREDYEKLVGFKNHPCSQVPVPFAACCFIFADTGLQVETLLKDGQLEMSFIHELHEVGKVTMSTKNNRWEKNVDLSVNGAVPADCVLRFVNLYQWLSVFLFTQRRFYSTSIRQYIEQELKEKVEESSIPNAELDERIISLGPVSPVTLYKEAKDFVAPPVQHQKHPCQYAFWVRGHTRVCRSGLVTWVRPHMCNKERAIRGKRYKLD